ncbi:MAG: carboxypeptidase-like regulatory domain-containing protein [Acidobacteriota bacterium]|nr:carboxypeptidase-like regulatory domain-containing protein [Acidobacteriota bacterium]
MNKQNFDINSLRVASPCTVGWETMSGDERVRHCNSCELNIYNITEMTKLEVEDLITKRKDRVCIRLYKRADGTVLTKDCPVGIRAYQKRVARFAGAALTTILGLFSVSFGQKEDKKSIDASKIKIVRTINQNQESVLSGIVSDSSGAVIAGVELRLYKEGSKEFLKVDSDDEGNYIFKDIPSGKYILEASFSNFGMKKIINLQIKSGEKLTMNVELKPLNTIVGIFLEEPLIDTTSSSLTTKFTRKQIENLPY